MGDPVRQARDSAFAKYWLGVACFVVGLVLEGWGFAVHSRSAMTVGVAFLLAGVVQVLLRWMRTRAPRP